MMRVRILAGFIVMLGLSGTAPYAGAATVSQSGSAHAGSVTPTGFITLLENPRDSSSLHINTDLFIRPRLSIGEAALVNPDPMKSWQAVQAKVWFHLPALESSALFLQSGVGMLQADPLLPSQNPWALPSLMVPFGFGMDHPTDSGRMLTTTFSLNLSDIKTGSSTPAHVMPELTFGIRF
ncbi:MAG TPA: hypothetical protein VGJ57_02715 [Nitrospirales bacterium]